MVAECKECGWEGSEDVLEIYKCPKCGSRNLRTSGSARSSEEGLNPPEGALKGD